MIPFLKQQRAASILGLALGGNRLEAVVLRRNNGTLQFRQHLVANLALSPLTGDPQLVGREIRNHLDKAGIRERRCAVCIPSSWVLSLQVRMPDLPEADLKSFLQIEGERGFQSGAENMFVVDSRFAAPSGEKFATLMAVSRNHLEILERVLKAANLKAASFGVGVTALPTPERIAVLTLAVGVGGVDLLVSDGGGIVALRSMDGAMENEGAQRVCTDVMAREIRITLGQLPGGFAAAVRKVRIVGQGEMARQFHKEIAPRLKAMELEVEFIDRASDAQFDRALPPEIAASPALALAAGRLRGAPSLPEFLPPKVQPWRQLLTTRMSSKRLAWIGGAAGAAALLVAGAFGVQQWKISRLQSQWDAMSAKVADLKATQDQIRLFRPWYDTTFRVLRIWLNLTKAFPEDGSVFTKSVEIRDLSTVTCSGTARDNEAFLAMHGKLGGSADVSGLHAETRGQKPVQFTLNYTWEGDSNNGN